MGQIPRNRCRPSYAEASHLNMKKAPRRMSADAPMKIINAETVLVPLDALTPHPKNPRQGDVGAIHESLTETGFYGSLIVQRSTGHVLAGNHRLKAAQHAGATELPITYLDVDDATALRILLADNRTNDLASYDDAALAELLQGIIEDDGSLAGTGYDGDALDALLADIGETGKDAALSTLGVRPLPTLTWVLVGIPTVRYPDIQEMVERCNEMDGVHLHVTANSDE